MRNSRSIYAENGIKTSMLDKDRGLVSEDSAVSSRGESSRSRGETSSKGGGDGQWWETQSSVDNDDIYSLSSSCGFKFHHPASNFDLRKKSSSPVNDMRRINSLDSSKSLNKISSLEASFSTGFASSAHQELIPRDVLTDLALHFGAPSRPSRSHARTHQRLWSSWVADISASSSADSIHTIPGDREVDHVFCRIADLLFYHDDLPVTIGALEVSARMHDDERSKVLNAIIETFCVYHQVARMVHACAERCVTLCPSGKNIFADLPASEPVKSALVAYCASISHKYFSSIMAPTIRGLSGPNRSLETSLKGTCDRILSKVGSIPCPESLQVALSVIYSTVRKRHSQRALLAASGFFFDDLLGGFLRSLQPSGTKRAGGDGVDVTSARFLGVVAQVFRGLGRHEPAFASDSDLAGMNDWMEGRAQLVAKLTKALTGKEPPSLDSSLNLSAMHSQIRDFSALHHFFVECRDDIYRFSLNYFAHTTRPPPLVKLWAAFDACQNRRRKQSPPQSASKLLSGTANLARSQSPPSKAIFNASSAAHANGHGPDSTSFAISLSGISPKTQRVAQMKTLVVDVDLSRRALNLIPRLDQFQSLQSLNISHNYIHILNNLPSTLKSLDASHNQIIDLSPILHLHHLETGNFSNNNISKIVTNVECSNGNKQPGHGLTKLVDLNLSHNKIESLKDLKNLPALLSISLGSNNIFSLDEFKYLSINNVSPKTMTLIDNPVSEDLQYISKISSLVPSVDHIDGIHVTRQRDWTVTIGTNQSSRLPQHITEMRASDVKDARRWIIMQGSAGPSLSQLDPSEIRYCSDESDPGEMKETTNQLSIDPEDFPFEPEPKEFPVLITVNASAQTDIICSEISVDSRNIGSKQCFHRSQEIQHSSSEDESSELKPSQSKSMPDGNVSDLAPNQVSHGTQGETGPSDEDIFLSFYFQPQLIRDEDIDTRVYQLREQFCGATLIKEARFSFNQAVADSGMLCIDFTLSRSTTIDEPTAQVAFSNACNQISFENSLFMQGSVTRWLIALVQKQQINRQFAMNPLVSKFLAKSEDSSVKMLKLCHKAASIKQLCFILNLWKVFLLKRKAHRFRESKLEKRRSKLCRSRIFQAWIDVVFQHEALQEKSLQKWYHVGKSKQNQTDHDRKQKYFIGWLFWSSKQSHLEAVRKKILNQIKYRSLYFVFTMLCDHARDCAHQKTQDATMKYVQQCFKVHAKSAVRSLNAAKNSLELFDSMGDLKRLKSICSALTLWKGYVEISQLRINTFDFICQCWKRVRNLKILNNHIREWRSRKSVKREFDRVRYSLDLKFRFYKLSLAFCFWHDWKVRVSLWREVRCMAILYIQNRGRMATVTRAWASELESGKNLPRRPIITACSSQQWQWKAFCSWLSGSGLEPSSIHEIWGFGQHSWSIQPE